MNRITSIKDIEILSAKDINCLLKQHGQCCKGSKGHKISKLCEIYGFASEPLSFQNVLAKVKNTTTGWTKDIRQSPTFELIKISNYLLKAHETVSHVPSNDIELFTKENLKRYKTLRSYNLYKSNHVHSLSFLKLNTNYCAIKGKCNPSWDTSGKMYDCIVLFSEALDDIVGSNCSCTAGQGEGCTHVAAMLFALEDFTSQGLHCLPDDPASTEVLCEWVKPKDPKVNPVPLKDLSFQQCTPLDTNTCKKRKMFDFNPVALEKRPVNPDSYKKLVHTLNLVQPDIPFLTIVKSSEPVFEGAEPVSDIGDFVMGDCVHIVPSLEVEVGTSVAKPKSIREQTSLYLTSLGEGVEPCADSFMLMLTATPEDKKEIACLTQEQTKSPLWKEYRFGMVTASIIHNVYTQMKSDHSYNSTRLVNLCLGNSSFMGNTATRYGIANEPKAAECYLSKITKLHKSLYIRNCGLFVMEKHSFIGATPDRIASCNCHGERVIEIKCPITIKDSADFKALKYLDFCENVFQLKYSHPYYSQVQCQMAATNTQTADFVVWTPKDILIVEVNFDSNHWQNLLFSSVKFFKQFVAPALFDCLSKDRNVRASSSQSTIGEFIRAVSCSKTNCKINLQTGASNTDFVTCDCSCNCKKVFHIDCTNLASLHLEEGESYPDWYCPTCVRHCDIIY